MDDFDLNHDPFDEISRLNLKAYNDGFAEGEISGKKAGFEQGFHSNFLSNYNFYHFLSNFLL